MFIVMLCPGSKLDQTAYLLLLCSVVAAALVLAAAGWLTG